MNWLFSLQVRHLAAVVWVLLLPAAALAEPGFYSLQDPTLPLGVKQAADSVFELRVVGARDESMMIVVDVSGAKGPHALASIKGQAKPGYFDKLDWKVVESQINRCEKFADIEAQKKCIVAVDIISGTGFLAGNGNFLWTAFHVPKRFFEMVLLFNEMSIEDQLRQKSDIRIFVFDKDGKLVVNPYVETVKPKFWPEQTPLAALKKSIYAEDSDFIGIEIGRKIGSPLPIGKATLQEPVFNLGFPNCTGCKDAYRPAEDRAEDRAEFADRSPFPNSPGRALVVSKGLRVEGMAELLKQLGIESKFASLFKSDQIIFSSADCVGGNSGGPILNSGGEVVGIVNSWVESDYSEVGRLCVGSRPPQFDSNM